MNLTALSSNAFLLAVASALTLSGVSQTITTQGLPISQINKDNRTIAVTATDSVTATADVATVHLGFIAYGVDHDGAYAAGSRLSNAIMDALKSSGVPADAVQSENQSLQPVQPYERQNLTDAEKTQRQFSVNQSWTVQASASNAARILDIAVKAGANQSGAIDWSLRDANVAQAAGKALQRARLVAEAMAKGLNVKLGGLIYASNETHGATVQTGTQVRMAGQAPAPPPLAITPKQVAKTATVYAVFAIE
jgi:hypothetical protein